MLHLPFDIRGVWPMNWTVTVLLETAGGAAPLKRPQQQHLPFTVSFAAGAATVAEESASAGAVLPSAVAFGLSVYPSASIHNLQITLAPS